MLLPCSTTGTLVYAESSLLYRILNEIMLILFGLLSGLIDMAIKRNSLIGGDDFKSGQTKMKSVLVDFLVGAGIKVQQILEFFICSLLNASLYCNIN